MLRLPTVHAYVRSGYILGSPKRRVAEEGELSEGRNSATTRPADSPAGLLAQTRNRDGRLAYQLRSCRGAMEM